MKSKCIGEPLLSIECGMPVAQGMLFCFVHYKRNLNILNEPWVKGLHALNDRDTYRYNKDKKRLISLDHLEEDVKQRWLCVREQL
jgi:hypothetical protein